MALKDKVSHLVIIVLLAAIALLSACNEGTIKPATSCLLNKIIYNDAGVLEFNTISGGKIYQINEKQILDNGNTKTLNTYQFKYNYDLTSIKNLSSTSDRSFIDAKMEDGQPIKVSRYFTDSGVTLTHTINYASDNIHIDVSWLGSDGTQKDYSYANYKLDEYKNVVEFEEYRYSLKNQDSIYLVNLRAYEYDNQISPWKGLILPFFSSKSVPDIKFFSANNILSIKDKYQSYTFSYSYNSKGKPTSLYTPSDQVDFIYLNCEN